MTVQLLKLKLQNSYSLSTDYKILAIKRILNILTLF